MLNIYAKKHFIDSWIFWKTRERLWNMGMKCPSWKLGTWRFYTFSGRVTAHRSYSNTWGYTEVTLHILRKANRFWPHATNIQTYSWYILLEISCFRIMTSLLCFTNSELSSKPESWWLKIPLKYVQNMVRSWSDRWRDYNLSCSGIIAKQVITNSILIPVSNQQNELIRVYKLFSKNSSLQLFYLSKLQE